MIKLLTFDECLEAIPSEEFKRSFKEIAEMALRFLDNAGGSFSNFTKEEFEIFTVSQERWIENSGMDRDLATIIMRSLSQILP